MTISLSYSDDIGRVQVSITDLPFSSGSILVERSTNELFWQTVRGAAALPVSGGSASVDDFEFSADVENHYRVTPVDPVPGLHLPGTAGSYASTPDHASLRITTDIRLMADVTPAEWGAGATQSLIGRYVTTGDQRSYRSVLLSDGHLGFTWSEAGVSATSATSDVAPPAGDGERLAVRAFMDVNWSATDWRVEFETAPTADGSWSQLDSDQDSPQTEIFAGGADLEVGSINEGDLQPFEGVVHACEVFDDDASTVVADPRFDEQAMGASSFDDSTGKTWTVHGDAYIAGTESSSITPVLGKTAWLKSIRHPFLNRPIHRVLAGGGQQIGRASRGAVFEVQGRSYPIAVTDVRSSREFTLTVQVEDETAARDMDLILASGDIFFIQVPPELTPHMAGGYVRIGDTVQHRVADTIMWRFTVPCRVVAPPGPGVVGGTMTYGALLNLYGGYQNVLAANSTYADLLALMASPDDLVVI